MLEARSKLPTPDRGPETGDKAPYGRDQNSQYKIFGRFTDREGYDPNSNQKLPIFQLTGYQSINIRMPLDGALEDWFLKRLATVPGKTAG